MLVACEHLPFVTRGVRNIHRGRILFETWRHLLPVFHFASLAIVRREESEKAASAAVVRFYRELQGTLSKVTTQYDD